MKCELCGQEGVKLRKVTETYDKGIDLLVIEDIPMCSCPHCGERYFTAETLHEIEHIKRHRREFVVSSQIFHTRSRAYTRCSSSRSSRARSTL
jgi:YgiT-type zinc finger domain-containing protein